MEKPPSSRKAGEEEDVPAKICACIYAAKAIAGSDLRRLPELIPILLQHNGLPVISIPLSVFSAPTRSKLRPTRRPVPRDHRREAQDEDDDVRCTRQPQKEEEEEAAAEGEDEEEENDEGDEDDGDSEETEHEDASADTSKGYLLPRPLPAATNTPRPAATMREDEPPPAAVYRIVQPPETNTREVKPPPAPAYKIVRAVTTREVKPPPAAVYRIVQPYIYIRPRETSRIIPSSKALTRGGVG
ncbi:hypothetical protein E2C01_070719 [Portunus trituberculatus]|uniref:Uncharacterized protein n=1 Tax=Portunus trituberculatus TaxID=210409 RepID=A0A5B7I320_PORTR|nr:hypothetical protein [Portunus trituberculatus]